MPGTQAEISNHNPLYHCFPPRPSRAIAQVPHSGHNNHAIAPFCIDAVRTIGCPSPVHALLPANFVCAYQYALVCSISSHNPVLSPTPRVPTPHRRDGLDEAEHGVIYFSRFHKHTRRHTRAHPIHETMCS